ncbi:hypothetical protein BH23ACT2_BH23ACT2_19480 [soil metagenome]
MPPGSARRAVLVPVIAGLLLAPAGASSVQQPSVQQPSVQQPSAPGGDIGAADAAELALDAVTDDTALTELRSVTSVDGRPVDLAAATAGLDGARPERLTALADTLAGSSIENSGVEPTSGVGDAAEARDRAEEILDDDKFSERDVPRPFRGVLEWLADRLRPVGRFLDDLFGPVIDAVLALPGGGFILAGVLVGGGAALTAWLISRRSRSAVAREDRTRRLVDPDLDPDELERGAEAAEVDGDLTRSVRLRYEAGLLRLVRDDRLELRADTTAAGAARQVDEPTMDRLTSDFEEIVYGSREAVVADVERSRHGWAKLLRVASRR